MIELTKVNGRKLLIDTDLLPIVLIEESDLNDNTVIIFDNGTIREILESVDEVHDIINGDIDDFDNDPDDEETDEESEDEDASDKPSEGEVD